MSVYKGASGSRSQSIYELTVPVLYPFMSLLHRRLRPLLFSNSGVGSFTSHKNQSLSEKTRNNNRSQTKAALSSQLFKDPESCSGRGSNPWPPAQQTGALPTELTRLRVYVQYNGKRFLSK